jgi:hypothetical protein
MSYVKSSSATRIAAGTVLGMLLVAGVLVLTTDVLGVEHLGPVIVYGVALVGAVAMLFAPIGKAR